MNNVKGWGDEGLIDVEFDPVNGVGEDGLVENERDQFWGWFDRMLELRWKCWRWR